MMGWWAIGTSTQRVGVERPQIQGALVLLDVLARRRQRARPAGRREAVPLVQSDGGDVMVPHVERDPAVAGLRPARRRP
jgi:hypothetical protein